MSIVIGGGLSLWRARTVPPALFLSRTGQPISPKKLSDRVSAYITAANIGKTGSCHLLRHMAATLMLEGGADIRLIQALLGHENLNTTQIYTHISISHLQAVHAQSHPGAKSRRNTHELAQLLNHDHDEDED